MTYEGAEGSGIAGDIKGDIVVYICGDWDHVAGGDIEEGRGGDKAIDGSVGRQVEDEGGCDAQQLRRVSQEHGRGGHLQPH